MEAVHDTQVTPARVSLVALLTVALLVFLALVSVLSWTVVFVFIAGFVLGPTFLVLAIYVGLHRAPKYIEQRTKQYVAGVALKDGHTAQELIPEVPHLQSDVTILVNPNNRDRVTHWFRGSLRHNMFLLLDLRPQNGEEPKKGAITMDAVQVTLVRARKGSPWKKKNYLELAHPTRALLGNARTLFVYFKTRRELEEWYYGLDLSSKHHARSSATAISSSIASPAFSSVFRVLAARVNPGLNAPPVEAPWFNALAQRIFFHYYNNPLVLSKIAKKINKQFDKLAKPEFLKSLKVLEVRLDQNLPFFDNLRLLQITGAGATKLTCDAKYGGGFFMKIEVIVQTPQFLDFIESRLIPAVLCARVKSLEGHLVVHMAAPPSDRLWLGFEGEPEIDLKVETEIDLGMENQGFNISRQFPKISSIIRMLLIHAIIDKTLLPEMEDIPLPTVGKDRSPSDFIVMRWETEELQKRVEDEQRLKERQKIEARVAENSVHFAQAASEKEEHRKEIEDLEKVKMEREKQWREERDVMLGKEAEKAKAKLPPTRNGVQLDPGSLEATLSDSQDMLQKQSFKAVPSSTVPEKKRDTFKSVQNAVGKFFFGDNDKKKKSPKELSTLAPATKVDDMEILTKESAEGSGRERSRSEGVRSTPVELRDLDHQNEGLKKEERQDFNEKKQKDEEEKKRREEVRRQEEDAKKRREEEEKRRLEEEHEKELEHQKELEKERHRVEEAMQQEDLRQRVRLEQEKRGIEGLQNKEEVVKEKKEKETKEEEMEHTRPSDKDVGFALQTVDEKDAEKLAGSTVHVFDDYDTHMSTLSSPREEEQPSQAAITSQVDAISTSVGKSLNDRTDTLKNENRAVLEGSGGLDPLTKAMLETNNGEPDSEKQASTSETSPYDQYQLKLFLHRLVSPAPVKPSQISPSAFAKHSAQSELAPPPTPPPTPIDGSVLAQPFRDDNEVTPMPSTTSALSSLDDPFVSQQHMTSVEFPPIPVNPPSFKFQSLRKSPAMDMKFKPIELSVEEDEPPSPSPILSSKAADIFTEKDIFGESPKLSDRTAASSAPPLPHRTSDVTSPGPPKAMTEPISIRSTPGTLPSHGLSEEDFDFDFVPVSSGSLEDTKKEFWHDEEVNLPMTKVSDIFGEKNEKREKKSERKTSDGTSAVRDFLKTGLKSLGTKLDGERGHEHTGFKPLDTALDDVFSAFSSRVKELSRSSSGKEERKK